MTVETTISRAGPYAGAGTVGPFPVPFRFLENGHLRLLKTNVATGAVSTLVLDTDYTVVGAGNDTGAVTLANILAAGYTLTVLRNVPATQEADYVENDPFPAESHEMALDKLTMLVQQHGEVQSRALVVPATDPVASRELPSAAARARRYLSFNDLGEPVATTFDIDAISQASQAAIDAAARAADSEADAETAAAIAVERAEFVKNTVDGVTPTVARFSGTGAQTVYTLPSFPGAEENTDVFISGVYQQKDTYSVDGDKLTFNAAPPIGTNNIEVNIAPNVALAIGDATGIRIDDNGTIRSLDSYVKDAQSYVKRAALQYQSYADILDATPRLAVGQIVESLYDQMRYDIDASRTPVNERAIVQTNDYSKVLTYSGRGARLRVTDGTGTYWWVRRGTAASNGGTVLKDALNRSWERENLGSEILAGWFDMFPTRLGGGDISPNIDAALAVMRETGKRLVFDEGWYMHSLPIVLRSGDWIEGAGYLRTRFQKPGKTPASGLAARKAPGYLGDVLGVYDDYNVDACFILYPEADSIYVYGVRLSGFYSESNQTDRSRYGLYAPRMCYDHFEDCSFSSQFAIYTRDCWMTLWDRVMGDRCSVAWYFDGGEISPGVYSGGTSNTFNSCFAHAFGEVGWYIKGLYYSSMNSVGADQGATNSNYPSISYLFQGSSVSINGGGSEGVIGGLFKLMNGSKVTTSNFFAGYFNEDAAKVAAITSIFNLIEVDAGSCLVLDNADLRIDGVVGKIRPYLVSGEKSVIDLRGSTVLPSSGEIDSGFNQWNGGIVRSQQGFTLAGYVSFDAPSGVLTVRRNSINVTVARVALGEYRIVVRNGVGVIGSISSSEARVEVSETENDSVTYKFYNSSGTLVDPRLVHWQGV